MSQIDGYLGQLEANVAEIRKLFERAREIRKIDAKSVVALSLALKYADVTTPESTDRTESQQIKIDDGLIDIETVLGEIELTLVRKGIGLLDTLRALAEETGNYCQQKLAAVVTE